MHEVDEDEYGIPEEGVEGAQDDPAPQAEEHAADGERDAQVEDAVDAVRGQVRQEEEDVGQLEVDVVDGQPVVADAELPEVDPTSRDHLPDVEGARERRVDGRGRGRRRRGPRGVAGVHRAVCRPRRRRVRRRQGGEIEPRRVFLGEVIEEEDRGDGGDEGLQTRAIQSHGWSFFVLKNLMSSDDIYCNLTTESAHTINLSKEKENWPGGELPS